LPLARALPAALYTADGRGAARILVSFQVDADGLLSVTAREETTGVEAAITVKPSYGLADAEIARMLEESTPMPPPTRRRALLEARVDLPASSAPPSALLADAALLDEDERSAIDGAVARLKRLLEDNAGRRELVEATEALNHASEEFAGRRMDRSVAQALTGRSVDTLR
jgi:molecular chaperone HscA